MEFKEAGMNREITQEGIYVLKYNAIRNIYIYIQKIFKHDLLSKTAYIGISFIFSIFSFAFIGYIAIEKMVTAIKPHKRIKE